MRFKPLKRLDLILSLSKDEDTFTGFFSILLVRKGTQDAMRRMAPSHPRHSPLKPRLSQRRLRISLTFLGVLALGGCSGGVLDPKGPIGAANSLIMINSLEIMLAVVIPTIIAGCVIAWWHRSSNTRALYRPDWAYSGRLELIVWSIPIMVILLISGVIWVGSHELDPAEPIQSSEKPLNVQVVSMDWKWLFMYPEQGVASVNDLYVPAGVPVRFSLTSSTVMNMFFVPQLGSMIATMNGMVTQLHLKADHPASISGCPPSSAETGSRIWASRFTLFPRTTLRNG